MSFSEPGARRALHTRAVTYKGFLREDGLFEIDAELSDTKAYETAMERGPLPPGEPVHGMRIRVTVGDDLVIRAIAADMDHTPFAECAQGEDPMQKMVGVRMGPGWRQAIEAAIGGVRGCTHLRELLFNMATAAYQTVFPWQERQRRLAGESLADADKPPYHLDRCIAWDATGPVVLRHYPQFHGVATRKRR